VIGQADFTHGDVNSGGLSASSLIVPLGVAVDAHGNLYVADYGNRRVLEYDAPLSTHASATRVIGQPDFTHNDFNNGGLSARSLKGPYGVALDAHGNLYVADGLNNRVLEYDAPLSTYAAAARVLGQPDFTHGDTNSGGLSASSLSAPYSAELDGFGNLYVADGLNNRVLEYDAPLSTHAAAARVFGQPDFSHGDLNNGGLSASSLNEPYGVAVDAYGNLYVADVGNSRVLEYDNQLILPLAHFLPLVRR
jgi:sugar lactone lactonase YvrE